MIPPAAAAAPSPPPPTRPPPPPLLPLTVGSPALAFLPDGRLVQGHVAELLPETDECRLRLEAANGTTRDLFLPAWRVCAMSRSAIPAVALAAAAHRAMVATAAAGGLGDHRRRGPPPLEPTPPPPPAPRRRRVQRIAAALSLELSAVLFLLGCIIAAVVGEFR